MQIFVKTLQSGTGGTQFDVESSTTVEDLIHQIHDKGLLAGVAEDSLKLIYAGKQLENGRTLGDYTVRAGSFMYVMPKLRGGSRRKSRVRKNRRNTRRRH